MRGSSFAALLTLGTILAACVSAQGAQSGPAPFTAPAPTQTQAAAPGAYPIAVDLPAGEYANDANHSSVTWRIRHEGLAWLTGRFDKSTATLTLDPADPSRSQLRATIDARSVDTNVLGESGQRGFDHQVQGMIGADKTQEITFVSTAIHRTGQNTADVTGDLTMNGQTHPITLNVTFDGGHTDPLRGHTALGFSAHASLIRSQWGVTSFSQFAGDEVQLLIEMELLKS
jgi:polyisoprenoid-binding protein YceI